MMAFQASMSQDSGTIERVLRNISVPIENAEKNADKKLTGNCFNRISMSRSGSR